MTDPMLVELLTMIQAARHARPPDVPRHLERAENFCRLLIEKDEKEPKA